MSEPKPNITRNPGVYSEIIKFQVDRQLNLLARNFLYILEDLKADDIICEIKYLQLRKRVLDYSGDACRNLKQEIEKL